MYTYFPPNLPVCKTKMVFDVIKASGCVFGKLYVVWRPWHGVSGLAQEVVGCVIALDLAPAGLFPLGNK